MHVSKTSADTVIKFGNSGNYDQYATFTGGSDWSVGVDYSNSNTFSIANGSTLGSGHKLVVTTAGNVGIGTTAPVGLLTISADTATTIDITECPRIALYNNQDTELVAGDFLGRLTFGAREKSASGTDRIGAYIAAVCDASWTTDTDDGASKLTFNVEDTTTGSKVIDTPKMVIESSGNVGIGTTDPNTSLEISGAGANVIAQISCHSDTEAHAPYLLFSKSDNTETTPALVDDNAVLGVIQFTGYDGTDQYLSGAEIIARVNGTPADNVMPCDLEFWTNTGGTGSTQRMTILESGNVGIGTANPSDTLHVAGDCLITSADGVTADDWVCTIVNAEVSDDESFGLVIQAGSTSADAALRIQDHNGANTLLEVEGGGKVGIGVAAPATRLHVKSPTNDEWVARFEHTSSGDTSNPPYGISILFSGGAPDNAAADPKFIDCSDTGGTRFLVYSDGDILADGVATASDERLKENIVDCTPKLDDVNKIKVRNFNWRECDAVTGQMRHSKNSASVKRIGVIAQEFETVFPSLIQENILIEKREAVGAKDAVLNEKGIVLKPAVEAIEARDELKRKTIKWSAMVPILISAVQELSAKVTALENA